MTVGFASGLGIGAVAFAQADSPSTPPPAPPAAAAPAAPAQADGHSLSKAPARGGLSGRWMQFVRRNWMKRLARRLHLDKTQRSEFRHIHAKAMAGIWAARADESLTRDQRRERIKAAVEAGRTDFRNLLTPDQRTRLDEIELRRERMLLGM